MHHVSLKNTAYYSTSPIQVLTSDHVVVTFHATCNDMTEILYDKETSVAGNFEESAKIRLDIISVEQTLPLRHDVLWPNKPISDVCLPEDYEGLHLGAFLPTGEQPVAVISLFIEQPPIDNAFQDKHCSQAVRFRKFACDKTHQGKGIGTKLLSYGLSMARSELNGEVAWCDARTTASEWYAKRGLVPFGASFFKSDVEYVRMAIPLVESTLSKLS